MGAVPSSTLASTVLCPGSEQAFTKVTLEGGVVGA